MAVNFQICFLCMKCRFSLFNRGVRCELCKQTVCSKCSFKVSELTVTSSRDSLTGSGNTGINLDIASLDTGPLAVQLMHPKFTIH